MRRCPVVDPDDHHLYVSLGCAAENLALAALAHGLHADVRFDPTAAGAIAVGLEATTARVSPLYQAIPARQCTRGDFDGQPLAADELRLLERAGSGSGVDVLLLTERTAIEQVLEHVVAGNTAQMNDPAFVEELKAWIRFGADEAARTGDGLFAGATGKQALPRWLGSRLMGLFFTPRSENERYARQIRKAFINQPVEVGPIRPRFASALGLGNRRPDLVVRFGRGPAMPLSMRRPVQAVLA